MASLAIYIKTPKGETIEKDVKQTDTIATLKQLIQNENNSYSIGMQKLIYQNKVIDDKLTFKELGIVNGSTLHLRIDLYMKINVHTKDNTDNQKTYSMLITDSIKNLRDEIAKDYPENTGIQLVYNGTQLKNEKTLEDSGIDDNACIHISMRLPGGFT